jgi:hypothetical protein
MPRLVSLRRCAERAGLKNPYIGVTGGSPETVLRAVSEEFRNLDTLLAAGHVSSPLLYFLHLWVRAMPAYLLLCLVRPPDDP